MRIDIKTEGFNAFLQIHAKKGGRFVPARLQAALALLERLREFPSLILNDHLSQSGSASIKSHETFGDKAVLRLKLIPINKNHGRRSSNLPAWGQELLNVISALGFEKASKDGRTKIIDKAQDIFGTELRNIIEEDPIEVRLSGRTAEAVVHDLLVAAQQKGKAGDVAQYLVGAKLALRFNRKIPVYPANKSDRTSLFDPAPRLGDFEIENAVIEIAVGPPDEKHLKQIAEILENSDVEVWLLTRSDRVSAWQNEIRVDEEITKNRVVVTSVEAFVGQNVTELGIFSTQGKEDSLKELFDLYNSLWIKKVGSPGIRIEVKI